MSAWQGMRGDSLGGALAAQEAAWNDRPAARHLYEHWYRLVTRRLSSMPGPTIELGSGIGRFKEFAPDAILTDVEPTAWTDTVVDAAALPFEDRSVANLVLFDVFHHLADPARFFDEATRALTSGGRAVIVDPYCSPVSYAAYRLLHDERTDLGAPGLAIDELIASNPRESNQARATLVFFRQQADYRARWPDLPIVERRRFSFVAYPLSGGFTGRRLAPNFLRRPLDVLEQVLSPAAPLLAFRCLVVLERT
jgi:SAM-dependent methyltransferase